MKEFFKKIVDKIKSGIEKIRNFFKKHEEQLSAAGAEVVKLLAGVGISAITIAGFKRVKTYGGVIGIIEWIGVIVLAGVLTQASDRYIDSEVEDMKQTMNEIFA